MNKEKKWYKDKTQEHTIHKPQKFNISKSNQTFMAECRECKKQVSFNFELPQCVSGCSQRMDLCEHGIACLDCSWRVIYEGIKAGTMRVDDYPQFKQIKEMMWKNYQEELIVIENNYLAFKDKSNEPK